MGSEASSRWWLWLGGSRGGREEINFHNCSYSCDELGGGGSRGKESKSGRAPLPSWMHALESAGSEERTSEREGERETPRVLPPKRCEKVARNGDISASNATLESFKGISAGRPPRCVCVRVNFMKKTKKMEWIDGPRVSPPLPPRVNG